MTAASGSEHPDDRYAPSPTAQSPKWLAAYDNAISVGYGGATAVDFADRNAQDWRGPVRIDEDRCRLTCDAPIMFRHTPWKDDACQWEAEAIVPDLIEQAHCISVGPTMQAAFESLDIKVQSAFSALEENE